MSLAVAPARPAFVVRDSTRTFFRVVVAFSFALPIRMAQFGDFEVALAMLMVIMGLPTLFSVPKLPGGMLLLGGAALGLLSVAYWDISPGSSGSFRPYLSYIFFFIPYVAYGLGYTLIRKAIELERFISLSAGIASIAGLGIAYSIYSGGLPVRFQGDLQGSLLGLPLYATHGVNTLAITEFVLFAFIWIDILFQKTPRLPWLLLKFAGLAALGPLVLLSLSRGATLSLAIFLVLSIFTLIFRDRKKALILLAFGLVGGSYVVGQYGDLITLAWSNRLNQSVNSAQDGDVNDLTSGRLVLVDAAITDIESNPLFGVGFGGFRASKASLTEEDAMNMSPHNQYLTMLWKPGLLAGILLLLFVLRGASTIFRLRTRQTTGTFAGLWCLTAAMLGIAAVTWDVLLVPNLGAMMMFLFGACASIETRERLKTS